MANKQQQPSPTAGASGSGSGAVAATGPDGKPITKQPMSELDTIQMRMNQVTDESLESTRRMLNLCEESRGAGSKTLEQLNHQREQLDRIDEGMDKINTDMREAEKNIEGLEKCCGLCVLPWKKGKNIEKNKDYKSTFNAKADGAQLGDGPRIIVDQNGASQSGGFVTKVTNDAREDEMDTNIGQVGEMVGNLRNMAIDMGNEITTQNQKLDGINQKASLNKDRIQQANTRADKLLK